MVEPVGATLGVVSLATALPGVFVSLVECFEYVELGRRFDTDFNKSQARLAALKLQITRWGVSTGALPDPRTGQRRIVEVKTDVADEALRLLAVIRDDTIELEKKMWKYGDPLGSARGMDLATVGLNDMDSPTRELSSQVNAITTKRVTGVSLRKRAKWAIYEKKHLDRLLEDITENLGLMEKLLPQVAEPQRALCCMEVEEVQNGQSEAVMQLLHDASQANRDTLLEQAVREAIISRGSGHRWERTEVNDEVKLQQGDRIAMGYQGQAPAGRIGHDYGVTTGKGRAMIHQGDVYGDK